MGDALNWVDPFGLTKTCASALQKIFKNTKNFHNEMQKYDPISDARGGHKSYRSGKLKLTVPGGHYIKLRGFQSGIIRDLEWYSRNNCYKCATPNDKRKLAAAGRVVATPVAVPPGVAVIPLKGGL